MSVYERRLERERNERWYGPWSETRKAIIAAKGSTEGVVEERGFDLHAGLEP